MSNSIITRPSQMWWGRWMPWASSQLPW